MLKIAIAVLCALLCGCTSPQFVKLDSSGKLDPSANPETLQRDRADCEVTAMHVRTQAGPLFGMASAKVALDNCMRSKGYLKASDG
jgi:hypothetical protein